MNETIPGLVIETNEDGTFTLEQDWSGNVDRVTVHPLHLRFMAERAGLVRQVAAGEADTLRTVAALKRRLRTLLDRINRLDEMLLAVDSKGHEDLAEECTFSFATWELASEFCEDLDLLGPVPQTQGEPEPNPAGTQRVPMGSDGTPPTSTPAATSPLDMASALAVPSQTHGTAGGNPCKNGTVQPPKTQAPIQRETAA